MTQRSHLFPFRTQKLSSVVPKILGWRRPGKIGRRRLFSLLFGAPEVSAASGGYSEPERAGQRRRAMREHIMREVSATRRNRKSSATARATSGRAEWFCKTGNLITCTSSSVGRATVKLYDQWLVRAHKWDLTVLSQKSRYALLAQLVEQLTLNQRAQGSSPWKCTTKRQDVCPAFFVALPPFGGGFPVRADSAPVQRTN